MLSTDSDEHGDHPIAALGSGVAHILGFTPRRFPQKGPVKWERPIDERACYITCCVNLQLDAREGQSGGGLAKERAESPSRPSLGLVGPQRAPSGASYVASHGRPTASKHAISPRSDRYMTRERAWTSILVCNTAVPM